MSLEGVSDEELLRLVEEEREKFTRADEVLLAARVGELERRGIYHLQPGSPHETVLRAVQFYGAHWHQYAGPLRCPHCDTDLCDREHGPPFKREIGREENDYIVCWECPDCQKQWSRGS